MTKIIEYECDTADELEDRLSSLMNHWIFRGQGTLHPAKPLLWRNTKLTFEEIKIYIINVLGKPQPTLNRNDIYLAFEIYSIIHTLQKRIEFGFNQSEFENIFPGLKFNKGNLNNVLETLLSQKNINSRVQGLGKPLSVAQHYGFPTRLLDFTENYEVALSFAAENYNNNSKDLELNGLCVYALRKRRINSNDLFKRDAMYDQRDLLPCGNKAYQLFNGYFKDGISQDINKCIHNQEGCFVLPWGLNAENWFDDKGKWPSIEEYVKNFQAEHPNDPYIVEDLIKFILKDEKEIKKLKNPQHNDQFELNPTDKKRQFFNDFVNEVKFQSA